MHIKYGISIYFFILCLGRFTYGIPCTLVLYPSIKLANGVNNDVSFTVTATVDYLTKDVLNWYSIYLVKFDEGTNDSSQLKYIELYFNG